MKIIIDALGGDYSPKAVIDGAIEAILADKDVNVVFVGPEDIISDALNKNGIDPSRYEIIHSTDAVLNTDHPATFFKEKPECSLALGIENLRKRDDVDALLSAGPTGALLTAATLRVGRLPGVSRPALIATLPTEKGGFVRLVDSGANMDCKPEYLLQFAIMADAYLKEISVANPVTKLLNVGAEEGKGDERSKAAFELLRASNLNFQGNIEADHVILGEADIVVTDGFGGNIFLKASEGLFAYLGGGLKKALKKNFVTKFGALFLVKSIKEVLAPAKNATKACAPLLGSKKLVLKCHGKSDAETFKASILQANALVKAGLQEKIAKAIADANNI